MRAFVIEKFEHPSKIPVSENVPIPTPKEDQVLVEVHSTALNFFDILQAQGKYQRRYPFPFVLGAELAGRIAANSPIPPGCPFKPGDRVFGGAQGTFGEFVATRWTKLFPLPDSLTFEQAASIYITWGTSYGALVARAELKPGEWVLVTAAAGGVGIAAVQLAKAFGANVIGMTGSASKLSVAKNLGGADYVLDYSKPGWQKEVLKITGGKGVDVVYDSVGIIKDSLKCIAWKGRALVVGFAGGEIEKLPLNLVLLKNISIIGVAWGDYYNKEPEYANKVWRDLLALFESKRISPVIYDQIYTLDTLVQGLADLEKRKIWGKAIVRVRDSGDAGVKAKI